MSSNLPTGEFTVIGEVAVDAVIKVLTAAVSEVLSKPEAEDGYGLSADACDKFVRNLLNDPESFADLVADNAGVNLSEPLDVNGEYAD